MRPEVVARGWIGTPYRHQGRRKGVGTDCLGLIVGVWREVVGPLPLSIPPYTPDWSEARREEVLWQAALTHLKPADTVDAEAGQVALFRMRAGAVAKHLGILAARNHALTVIHAYQGHGVIESPLTSPWRRKIVARFEFPERRD